VVAPRPVASKSADSTLLERDPTNPWGKANDALRQAQPQSSQQRGDTQSSSIPKTQQKQTAQKKQLHSRERTDLKTQDQPTTHKKEGGNPWVSGASKTLISSTMPINGSVSQAKVGTNPQDRKGRGATMNRQLIKPSQNATKAQNLKDREGMPALPLLSHTRFSPCSPLSLLNPSSSPPPHRNLVGCLPGNFRKYGN
jgi:hypothetical protein